MALRLRILGIVASTVIVAGRALASQPSCADDALSVAPASAAESNYFYDTAQHVVDAAGVAWSSLPDRALALRGTDGACWLDGVVQGPYGGPDSFYECEPQHCPVEGCPTPCLAYHSTECVLTEAAGGASVEGLTCTGYGDGVTRQVGSGDVVIRRAHFHELLDDAVEDDHGLTNTRVFDSLIDGTHIAFGDRQRSDVDNDATGTEWEVRRNLVRVRGNLHPYRLRPGHGGIWKGDRIATHQHRYRITDNVFVAEGPKQSGLIFPVVTGVDECADNVLLWAGPIAGDGGWEESLLDQSDFPDGLTDGQRLAALELAFPGCFQIVLKPETMPVSEFLAVAHAELGGKSWQQLVAEWSNTPPSVLWSEPADGTSVVAGAAVTLAATASDAEDGDLTAALAWSSDLAGPLGTGGTLAVPGLAAGTHVLSARVTDSGGLLAEASRTLEVTPANLAPLVSIEAPSDGAHVGVGALVSFAATASDAEDGDLSGAITWSTGGSPLGAGASFETDTLAVGEHVITASAMDSAGQSGEASLTLSVDPANGPPLVAIAAPTDGASVLSGATVSFTASAEDPEDGDLSAALVWTSSLDGELDTGAEFTASWLRVGTHLVTARALDAEGLAGEAAVSVTVRIRTGAGCGVGPELAAALPLLMALRRRRAGSRYRRPSSFSR